MTNRAAPNNTFNYGLICQLFSCNSTRGALILQPPQRLCYMQCIWVHSNVLTLSLRHDVKALPNIHLLTGKRYEPPEYAPEML